MNSEPPRPVGGERQPPRRSGTRASARVALSAAGPIFFLPPALAVADRDFTIFSVPALVIYIFAVWLVGIILIAASTRQDPPA